ncbi:MAG: aspartyl protease family protein [Ignavibacteriae bacterium]|nr:aspartyl protease family protein [Ignavibacteriota bacterium]MCB9243598.1 aspartyl protease family protein [Ignavibacteriales bacterium]
MRKFILTIVFLISISGVSRAQTYPINISEDGFIFVEVTLNDSVKSNFVLDTGAGIIVISNKTLQKLDGSLTRLSVGTGFRSQGDRVDLPTYLLPSISIGEYKKSAVKIGVFGLLDDYGMDGLVSLKMFEDQPFTIDFKNKLLILNTPAELSALESSGKSVPIKFNTMTDMVLDMFIPVCLNDSITIDAEFDTGSGFRTFFVNPFFIDKLGLDAGTMTVTGTGKNGAIPKVEICGTGTTQLNMPAQFETGLIYEGLIGSGIFKDKKVTIDIPDSQMIIND